MCATSDKNDSTTIFTLSNGDMKMNEQVENELEQFDNDEMNGDSGEFLLLRVRRDIDAESIIERETDELLAKLVGTVKATSNGISSLSRSIVMPDDPICNVCGKKYSNKTAKNRHMKRDHPGQHEHVMMERYNAEKKEKKYSCEPCRKHFASKYSYDMHQRIHSGTRSFACTQCQRSYPSAPDLRKHIKRVHNNGGNGSIVSRSDTDDRPSSTRSSDYASSMDMPEIL